MSYGVFFVVQRISSAKQAKCFISLMQADRKLLGSDTNVPIRFTVTAVKKSYKGRLWHEDPSEVTDGTPSLSTIACSLPCRSPSPTFLSFPCSWYSLVAPWCVDVKVVSCTVCTWFGCPSGGC